MTTSGTSWDWNCGVRLREGLGLLNPLLMPVAWMGMLAAKVYL